jgi:hypothetical protein
VHSLHKFLELAASERIPRAVHLQRRFLQHDPACGVRVQDAMTMSLFAYPPSCCMLIKEMSLLWSQQGTAVPTEVCVMNARLAPTRM